MVNASKNQNIQDKYLNQLRKEKTQVTIYLTNGVRLKGIIKGFDNFVVLFKEATLQMIYKHAISSIVPDKDIDLRIESNNEI